MAGNRGLSDALVGSGAVALVEPGSTMPAATSAPTIAATAVIKPAMAVSTPGNVVQNPTAGFSSPMDQTPLCVSATPTGEPDENEREHSTSSRLVWRVHPPDGPLTDHPEGGGTRDDRAQQDRSHDVFVFAFVFAAGIGANTVRSRIPARPVRLRCGRFRTAIPIRRCCRPGGLLQGKHAPAVKLDPACSDP